MIRLLPVLLVVAGLCTFTLGCDDSQPTNSVENATAESIADYERKIAEENDPSAED